MLVLSLMIGVFPLSCSCVDRLGCSLTHSSNTLIHVHFILFINPCNGYGEKIFHTSKFLQGGVGGHIYPKATFLCDKFMRIRQNKPLDKFMRSSILHHMA